MSGTILHQFLMIHSAISVFEQEQEQVFGIVLSSSSLLLWTHNLLLIEDLLLYCGLLTFIVWNGLEILTAMNLVRVAQLGFQPP